MVSDKHVAALRSFNRFYTQRIGVLEKQYLSTPFSLTQGRVLYELAHRKSTTAVQIATLLGLDQGYLSRMLQGFVTQGLVRRSRSREDTRSVTLMLTAAGHRAFRQLDRHSVDQTASLLTPLPASSRSELISGVQRIQRALSAQPEESPKVTIRQHTIGDLGWAIELHGRTYAEQFGWNEEFEALVATLFAAFATKHDPATERFWVTERNGERVGCVFLVRNEDDSSIGQLRCLLVDPSARGLGVGQRLVHECVKFALAVGYRGMMLWTNDVLVSARRIYEAAGFQLTKEYKHHSFGRNLVGQVWCLHF